MVFYGSSFFVYQMKLEEERQRQKESQGDFAIKKEKNPDAATILLGEDGTPLLVSVLIFSATVNR